MLARTDRNAVQFKDEFQAHFGRVTVGLDRGHECPEVLVGVSDEDPVADLHRVSSRPNGA